MPEQREYRETLTVTYESGAQRADAKAVGSSILAIQSIVDEVQSAFEENEQILLKARPFAQGSLELPLEMIVLGAAVILHEYPLLQKVREVIAQYFDIKRRLRGQAIRVEEGNVILIEGSPIHVDQITLQCLHPASAVSQRCSLAFHDIEEDPEIKGVRVYSSTSAKPLVRIHREEFRYYHPETPIEEQHLGQREERSRETLVIRQPAFDPALAWRFIWRGVKIAAKVEHEEFLERIEEGREPFLAGDSLEVDLHRVQEYDPTALTYADKQYVVAHVHKHKHRPHEQQGQLFE